MTEERRTDTTKRDRIREMEAHCNTGLEIVAKLSKRVRIILACVVVLLLGLGVLSYQGQGTAAKTEKTTRAAAKLAKDNERLTHESARLVTANSDAIRLIGQSFEKGCVLLANAIVAAGGGPPRKDGKPTDQQRLTILRLTVLSRAMTPRELAEQARLTARLKGKTGFEIPDCKKLAKDPSSVVPVQQAHVPPPPPPPLSYRNP